MVIPAGAQERRRIAQPLGQLEPEDAVVESERALEVGDLQVHVADVYARIDGFLHGKRAPRNATRC